MELLVMRGKRILLIEDDQRLARSIMVFLEKEGFVVRHFGDGDSLGQLLHSCAFDLVLCDVMLPGADGFEICQKIKSNFNGPYLFLSALSDVDTQLRAFELGADDFIIKPVDPGILLARILARFRRSQPEAAREMVTQVKNLVIDKAKRCAHVEGESLSLSTSEFDLLWLLANHPHQALSREFLFIHTVGRRYDGLDRTIDGRISRLRKKLESVEQLDITVRTVWGQGYLLADG
ncbi:response regulator transcription factor [Microbulbifer pacificus]|uniref:Response regulator transcription factor n=1 Tax=Microbulbifer pacificus TaxID=407164 RepID=A0AAU0N2S7_9GAMM|nr:response regulator transcription factor [Microbulbifer pacificus]WOX06650.1 response regulator transcription factor [Microbulbifer pacificus]